jgi:hypothetical protein
VVPLDAQQGHAACPRITSFECCCQPAATYAGLVARAPSTPPMACTIATASECTALFCCDVAAATCPTPRRHEVNERLGCYDVPRAMFTAAMRMWQRESATCSTHTHPPARGHRSLPGCVSPTRTPVLLLRLLAACLPGCCSLHVSGRIVCNLARNDRGGLLYGVFPVSVVWPTAPTMCRDTGTALQ